MIQTETNKTLQWLNAAAERTPDKPAFVEPGGLTLSWADFRSAVYAAAAAISAALTEEDRRLDRPVVLLADRSARSAAAVFAAVAAGVWYLPLDPELPSERMKKYLSICRPAAVVTHGGTGCGFDFSGYPVVDTDACAPADGFVPVPRGESLPAFGIFTSGSTGAPKLVVKSRRAIESFIGAYCDTFAFSSDEIFGNQIPFFFDASTKDLFAAVRLGATVVLLPGACFSFPKLLIDTMNETRVTSAVWVPEVLKNVVRFGVLDVIRPQTLKKLLFVGERMPVRALNAWIAALPDVTYVNLYGSTEVAGNSCYYVVDRAFDPAELLPIGKPFPGTRVFLIDPETGRCADEGEICVAGDGLAEGYFGDAEKTAAAFLHADLPGFSGRIYRSGDFGRRNERGELVCVSRRDGQIKYMGHRIELGDIETAACSLPYIAGACCFFLPEREKIVLCAAAPADCKARLRADLSALLPDYMIPHRYRFFDAFPLNANGKTDRAKLRALCEEK